MYGEMINEMDQWMDQIDLNEVNFELQSLADGERIEEINQAWEAMMEDFYYMNGECSDLEASHYMGE